MHPRLGEREPGREGCGARPTGRCLSKGMVHFGAVSGQGGGDSVQPSQTLLGSFP